MGRRSSVALALVAASVSLVGCDAERSIDPGADAGDAPPAAVVGCGPGRGPLPPLVEDRSVYDQEGLEVWTLRLEVEDRAAFDAVNEGVEDAEAAVLFVDDTAGTAARPGTLQIRGGASRRNAQKNWKIELADGAGLWRGQREINLNKHMWDLTRVRNKLSFDLFRSISDLTSLRTQFVRLSIDGEDFGLYTWIEEPDRRFLASHGLDPEGQLYKAAAFSFEPIDPALVDDPTALAALVEPKANPDPAKFLRMVAAVNDLERDIDEVVATYFERDNLVTWLAVNLLVNNIDTRTQNYYLYSPSSCDGWYFLPWDYDGAWSFYDQGTDDVRERWEAGLANWWTSELFERFVREPANVAAVEARMGELSGTVLTDELTAAYVARYRDLVRPSIGAPPDLDRLPGHRDGERPADGVARWEAELERITGTVSRFLAEYDDVAERPMPVHVDATVEDDEIEFRWDPSYDLQQDPITYDLEVSETLSFGADDLVDARRDLVETSTEIAPLPPGTYWWRVIIRDQASGSWQLPYDDAEELVIDED